MSVITNDSQTNEVLETIKKRIKSIKERQDKECSNVEAIEDKTIDQPVKENGYKVVLKVASMVGLVGLFVFTISAIIIPDFQQIIGELLNSINIFSPDWGVDQGQPTDFVNDIIN